MKKIVQILSKFKSKEVLVIGDVIFDQHIIGSVSRISPEAPVPVVLQEESFSKPGGAANVGFNLNALGAKVFQVGRIGKDPEGEQLKRQLQSSGINTSGFFVDKKIPTITKTRIIGHHQQIVRIDKEDTEQIGDSRVRTKILNFIQKKIEQVDAVIISDYGKGMIDPELLDLSRECALEKGIPIVVDPKVEHFECYRRVTAITPNKSEAENAIRNLKVRSDGTQLLDITTDKLVTLADIDSAGKKLLKYLDLESLLITLGEQGMGLFEKDKNPHIIETKSKEIYDVTGAGDTVISVFSLCLTTGATKKQAAEVANVAAGIVVGKMGAATVSISELRKALKELHK